MEGSASQAGFYYQNNIAALKIIECLFFDTDITHVVLENYEKGNHIDDVIIYKKNKIDYYQIKWSDDSENSYTLHNLLTSSPLKKSIFRQLAEGYLSVKPNNLDFSIILFTTKRASSQKRPSEGLSNGLTEIITHVIQPLKTATLRYDALPNYALYENTLNKIKVECALDDDSFNDFLKRLDFKFSQETTDQIQNASKFKLNKLGIEENLFEKLIDGVVNWSISGEAITKEKVLKQFGISDRFEDKLPQYFKVVDEKYYVPNQDLFDKLNGALTELKGGYIFIEGLPGIGKSTALTKFKETNPEITFAYYCFIPDAKNDFGELRHKSEYFLKSMCIAIENNFPNIDLPSKYSNRYEEKLASYINKLGTLHKKIIFIVDGLDHVHRDIEFQESSLLNQIKGNLPDGVFFLLSSQYKTVLSSSVATEINLDPKRHIVVSKFSQKEITRYLLNKGISANENLDQIEKVSDGIPLYLHYISELLIKTEKKNYKDILKDLPSLADGKINSYHEYLFQKIENNETAKWVLAVLAYRKENSSVETILEILKLAGVNKNITDIQDVVNKFSHLLRQNDGRSYSIFHNSFREFVLSKTITIKDKFNIALILFYEQNPYSDEAYRNYFRHLGEVGNYQKIVLTTTLEWIKTAWANFRMLTEIKDNIDLALNACIETQSLSDFIKIAFLKAQIERLIWNMEGSEIDFHILFLNANLEQNSIRSIWDGDFVLTNKPYFAYYLGEYYSKTGNLLPHKIIQQGFSKALIKGESDKITAVLQAEALVSENIIDIFNQIDTIKWIKSDRHKVGYVKEKYSEKENSKANLKIKLKIVDYLFKHKRYNHLLTLSKAFSNDFKIHTKVQISIAKLLLRTEKNSAIGILETIDFSKLSNKEYFRLISFCSEFLRNDEILLIFKKQEITIPNLRDNIISKEGMQYTIHKDVIELFDFLKSVWLFHPELISQLLLKVSILPSPSKNVYSSIFYLSELWNKERNENLTEADKITRIKKAIQELYVSKPNEGFRKVNYGLFDHTGDDYFISNSIDSIFDTTFKFTTEKFKEESITEIVDFWFSLEEGDNGFKNYKIPLGLAMVLNSSSHENLEVSILKLIQHAEKLARLEEETVTLTMYLGKIANVYAICGFLNDFKRIYNQLIEISFGLGTRKDYQASYIVSALEAVHKTDPLNTLNRLTEVFTVQNLLGDAGNGRMHHICISELIAFTAQHYPELAFLIIDKEEKNINRAETIEIVLKSLIKHSQKENLPVLFSLIKTLPRWSKGSTTENYFLVISITLLERAIQLKDEDFIFSLIDEVKYNAIVELEDTAELDKFSEMLIKSGRDITLYSLAFPKKKEESKTNMKSLGKGEKFSIKHSSPAIEDLIQLFEKNYNEFEKYIQSEYEICLRNKRIQTFRNEYYRSKSTFEEFYKSLPLGAQFNDSITFRIIIRNYIELKKAVVESNPIESLKYLDLEIIFNDFVSKTKDLFPTNTFESFIKNKFELDKWIDNILQFTNGQRDFVFREVIPEESIYKIVEQVSILRIDDIISFVDKWTSETTNAISLLKIANRLVPINPEKAKEILHHIANNESDNFLFPRREGSDKLGFDIIETFLKSDPQFGKRFLLKSYVSQKAKYGDDLIAGIDKLLKYKNHFADINVSKAYYESNFQYNKELAKGLPQKPDSYEYISLHKEKLDFPEIIIRHIINLFDHPVIKIRELALQSLFDLVFHNPGYLKSVFKFGIENGSNNQIEYCLIVFHSISLRAPEQLFPFKNDFIQITNKNHFNILESIKELLIRLLAHNRDFLTPDEKTTVTKLNTKSPILYNNLILNTKKAKNFIYSDFQWTLIKHLYENENDETEITDDIYTDLSSKNLNDYTMEKEGAIHRIYNINNNFDTIEINSPYYEEVKTSTNQIFNSKIKKGCFDDAFVNQIKTMFRLYDPSKLLYKKKLRPSYINWLPNNISESDFINFKDFKNLSENFIKREDEYLTLFEYGSQRSEKEYGESLFACYFEISAYLKKKGFDDSVHDKGIRKLSTSITQENLYSFELPTSSLNFSSPVKEMKPLLEISLNNFRGEKDLANAILLSDVFNDFNIEESNLLNILVGKKNYSLDAFRWQNSYTSGSGRRRYKPNSEGFTIKIKKAVILKYLLKHDMVLCYDISLKRSTTKHKPEDYMEWFEFRKRIEAQV